MPTATGGVDEARRRSDGLRCEDPGPPTPLAAQNRPGDPTKAEPGSDAWVFWRCDSKPVLTKVVLGHGTPTEGRDPSKDIVRLMEIVQQRYSELNGDCEIRPPESVPTDPTSTSSKAEGST